MEPRDGQLIAIGGLAGLVGFMVYVSAPFEEILPVNQTIFAINCALLTILTLMLAVRRWSDNA